MHTNPGVLLGAGHIPVPALGLGLVQQPVRIPVQLFHRPGLFHQQDPYAAGKPSCPGRRLHKPHALLKMAQADLPLFQGEVGLQKHSKLVSPYPA